MAKERLLIVGDSFATPYPNDSSIGWPLLAREHYKVTNLAQAGVSEYKIFKQLKSVSNIGQYDFVVVAHTSPYRVHTRNSIHNTELHKDCDLLMSDVEAKTFTLDPAIRSAKGYFKYHFDPDYYQDVYNLIRKEINNLTRYVSTLHIDHFDMALPYAKEKYRLDLSSMWPYYKGSINHYTEEGNQIVFARIQERLKDIECGNIGVKP